MVVFDAQEGCTLQTQLKFPEKVLTCPKGQSLHSLEPAASLNFPAPHSEHDFAEAPEYEPTVQTWQVSAD